MGEKKKRIIASPSPFPISCERSWLSQGWVSTPGWHGLLESWGEWLQIWGRAPWVVAEGDWGRTGQIPGRSHEGLCLLFQCKLAISRGWRWATSLARLTGSTWRFVLGWGPTQAGWQRAGCVGTQTRSIPGLHPADCSHSRGTVPRDPPHAAFTRVGGQRKSDTRGSWMGPPKTRDSQTGVSSRPGGLWELECWAPPGSSQFICISNKVIGAADSGGPRSTATLKHLLQDNEREHFLLCHSYSTYL